MATRSIGIPIRRSGVTRMRDSIKIRNWRRSRLGAQIAAAVSGYGRINSCCLAAHNEHSVVLMRVSGLCSAQFGGGLGGA
jgi:hypothetical protein